MRQIWQDMQPSRRKVEQVAGTAAAAAGEAAEELAVGVTQGSSSGSREDHTREGGVGGRLALAGAFAL